MQHRPTISKNSLISGYRAMNARVFAGAILGICLHTANFYFAPVSLIFSAMYLVNLGIYIEVSIVVIVLHIYGPKLFARQNGIRIFRILFVIHATAYSTCWGVSCSYLLITLQMHPYSISVIATAMAAATVAVSTFSFDLIACTFFLNCLFIPILYTTVYVVENALGIVGACTLCYFFFHVLGFAINRAAFVNYSQQETIEKQALSLQKANRELNESNQMLQGTIDSIDELFLVVDQNMVCYATPTERTAEKLQAGPIGKNLIQIFRLTDKKAVNLESWFNLLISGTVDFDVLAPLGPAEWVDDTTSRTYRLRYALLTEGSVTRGVIVIMTDITRSLSAEKMALAAEANARFILAVSSNRTEFANFLKRLDAKLLSFESADASLESVRRDLHDLKVIAGIFSLTTLVSDINRFELLLKAVGSEAQASAIVKSESRTIRKTFASWRNKEASTLNRLRVFEPEEIVIQQKFASRVRSSYESDADQLTVFDQMFSHLRSKSVDDLLRSYDQQIQKVAAHLDKKVQYTVVIHERTPRLLNTKLNLVFDSLFHLFNNALDHGLESPEVRVANGKSEVGHLLASAQLTESSSRKLLVIRVDDDGVGLNAKQIAQVAKSRGLSVTGLSDSEICQLIFSPGFSTKQEATHLSGQGIGLSALAYQLHGVGGSITVSALPTGTRFELQIPVSDEDIWMVEEKPTNSPV